ncbi:hypothetical protein F0249_09360 [Vibrio sp. 03-59-1]|uniref:hypothetical protein n=1 Tax=Vibrio sp. 03-59-1 TaxID=2607607 RepID=UPI001493916F|nr:hypothetical protein [Vibrio sp. 03-59-1]NOH84018.1 hypothetical protein [Vibrio sp. 03-59-1]
MDIKENKKITYLFGAGASANRVPLVSGIQGAFENFYVHQTISFLMYGCATGTSERFERLIHEVYQNRSSELLGLIEWYCLKAAPDHQRNSFGGDKFLAERLEKKFEIKIKNGFQSVFRTIRQSKKEGNTINDWDVIHAILFENWVTPTVGRGYFLHKILTLVLKSAHLPFHSLVVFINQELADEQLHKNTQYIEYFKQVFPDVNFVVQTLDSSKDKTFDETCKYFYQKNEKENLDRMKRSLELMFLHLQNITYYRDINDIGNRFSFADPRYDVFFKKVGFDLLDSGQLCLLSWNYDHQIELSDINDIRYKSIIPSSIEDGDGDITFFKLNGSLALTKEDISSIEHDGIDTIEFILEQKLSQIKKDQPHISFSFERPKQLENVLPKLRDTQTLVAIGYSFPKDNFETDKTILESMKNLTDIYIQLPKNDCDRVIEKLKNEYLIDTDVNFEPVTDLSEFYIVNRTESAKS